MERHTQRKDCIAGAALAALVALAALAPYAGAATPATASPATPLVGGAFELSPRVSFVHSNLKREGYGNVDRFTSFDFSPAVGFCVSDRFEVTGGLLLRHETVNDQHQTALGASAGIVYNFSPQGSIVPFAGAGFGTLFNDGFTFDGSSVLAPAITAGIRMFVGSASAINFSMGYEHETDGEVSTNRLLAGVGVSLFPWRAR